MSKTTRSAVALAIALLLIVLVVAWVVRRPGPDSAPQPKTASTTAPARGEPPSEPVTTELTTSTRPATAPIAVVPPPNEDGIALLPTPAPATAPPAAAPDAAACVTFAPDGRLLVARSSGLIELIDLVSDQRQRVDLKVPGPRALTMSPRAGRVAAANAHALEVWHATSSTRSTPAGHGGDVTALMFTRDGATLVSGHAGGAVKVWDVASWTVRATLQPNVGAVVRIALAPNAQHVAVAGNGVGVCLLTGGPVKATLAPGQLLSDLAFSPDGLTLATAGPHGVTLWDTMLWQKRAAPATGGAVSHVAFGSGGRALVTVGADGSIRTWDMATRQPLTSLSGATPPIASMALSDDGQSVAACDASGVMVWNLSTRTPRRVR